MYDGLTELGAEVKELVKEVRNIERRVLRIETRIRTVEKQNSRTTSALPDGVE